MRRRYSGRVFCPMGGVCMGCGESGVVGGRAGIKREKRRGRVSLTLFRVGGGFLLSRLRSIIGVIRFNFSVRYG